MMNQKTSAGILALSILFLPTLVYGASLIPCGETPFIPDSNPALTATHPCDFEDIIRLANTIIKFLMIDVAVPLAAIGLMFIGGRLVLMPNKESSMTEAKEGAMFIVKGFGIMLGAYVLIKTVIFAFLSQDQLNFMQFVF